VVGDIAGVVEAIASMVGVVADADEEVIDVDRIASSMIVVARLLKPMVQVIWSTVNMRSFATATKSRMMTIWFT